MALSCYDTLVFNSWELWSTRLLYAWTIYYTRVTDGDFNDILHENPWNVNMINKLIYQPSANGEDLYNRYTKHFLQTRSFLSLVGVLCVGFEMYCCKLLSLISHSLISSKGYCSSLLFQQKQNELRRFWIFPDNYIFNLPVTMYEVLTLIFKSSESDFRIVDIRFGFQC